MSEVGLITLVNILADESRPAWERTRAGRTLMARTQKRISEIDKDEQERTRAQVQREADAFARRGAGEA
jgi:hypothetical protein